MHAVLLIQRSKRSGSNQTSKRDGENVASIQDRDAGSDLLACVEQRQNVQGTRVERGLDESEEESNDNQSRVVLDESGQCGDDTPDDHAAAHVD